MTPVFSIVLPTFNRARSIERAVHSVLEQSFADLEVIVVDDGSTDDTAERLGRIADPRLRLVRQQRNAGGGIARNLGIRLAQAPLLGFLDSDDAFLPDKLAFEAEFFRSRPDAGMLLSGFITDHERKRADVVEANPVIDEEGNAALLEALFLRQIRKATPGIAVRTQVARAIGGFDEELRRRQDFDFIVRAARQTRIVTTDRPLWIKSYPADAISSNHDSFVAGALAFHRRHPEQYDNPIYRRGFALDVARHFRRRIKAGQPLAAVRDFAALSAGLGAGRAFRLWTDGRSELTAHRRSRRARRRVLEG
jgi:glycosyltransferase involved in cell wall biosynthesis